ncbi:hypothetical protein BN128_4228 [Cronobacter sakazakii 696]|nr:hypothetical protein BN128_4228 [Cronobacter sakazakii 696]
MRCRHHPTGIPGINRQQALFGAKELSTRVLMQGRFPYRPRSAQHGH